MINEITTTVDLNTEYENSLYVPVSNDVSHLTTQRSKIVFLHNQGLSTSQIAKQLTTKEGKEMRYQHVRNELINAGLYTKKR